MDRATEAYMKYSAEDIANQTFELRMRGFDRQQVEEFLQRIGVEWERLVEENRRKSKRMETLGREVKDFRKREKSLVDALETARRMSREIKEQADREADLVVGEAELKAERILARAEWRLGELRTDFLDLQQCRIRFEAELRALLDGHGRMLERFDDSRASDGVEENDLLPTFARTGDPAGDDTPEDAEDAGATQENEPARTTDQGGPLAGLAVPIYES
jgi:cell division initiation protein